mmetsp:Transcript_25066/g.34934  ORF Transcript_25066/g.34934 Transcript_25066/m.34934 type:complete len:371 (-) Transcript_25066:340-1452(-)|eukprot:CAMPEP_0184479252 /NCGR_PEP_ID=MMETSP0113_2-20130426/1048_1 /TAXON_ID=91329 /ORGANISM="Norrisiella sphaerica, Strain BC52" /LENGTH=370 /DNA_ID=CAMNT_0026857291 /DNA_START=75 /DNA_END=1187 /DNA_ORIENTATION=+
MPATQSVFWFSVGAGAISWVCFKMYEYEAGALSSTPSVPIEDLGLQLDTNGEASKVTLEGIVACDEPIETKHKPGTPIKLVIYSLTKIAHYATTSVLGGWTDEEKQSTESKSVPFRIIPEGSRSSSSIGVTIPAIENSETSGVAEMLTVVGDHIVENKFTFQTFVEQTRTSGRIHRSSQYVESGLEVGTPITVVGPVSMNKDGQMKMVAQPTVISKKSRYELISEAEERATSWQYAFYICAGAATACVAYMGYKYMQDYLQRRLARRRLAMLRDRPYRVVDGKEGPLVNDDPLKKHITTEQSDRKQKYEDTNADEDERKNLCVVCQENAADAVLMGCRHLYTCVSCTMRLSPRNCPICRQPIKRVIKVYN